MADEQIVILPAEADSLGKPVGTGAAAAMTEINQIMSGGHPLSEAWKKSDRAALDHVTNLWKIAAPETDQSRNEQHGDRSNETEHKTAGDGEDEHQPESNIPADEADRLIEEGLRLKQETDDHLRANHGEQYEAVARNAGEMVSFLNSDERDAQVYERIETALGNDVEFIELLAERRPQLGELVNNEPAATVELSESEKTSLAQRAVMYLFNGKLNTRLFQRVIAAPGDGPEVLDYCARLGQKLFMSNKVIDNTEPKPPVAVDAKDVQAAQKEISQIYNGRHRLSDAWKRGEHAARNYMTGLFKRTTGGQ